MSPSDAAAALERIARDLDLVVYRLERPTEEAEAERRRLRRELDRLRERIEDVSRALG
jgi:phage shock protein A